MARRQIRNGIDWVGAIDWHRRLFDALIPLPDGTSYNAYLVRGSEKTALIDTVDPAMAGTLLDALSGVDRIDVVIANHAEQDHSGSLPMVLARYPKAAVFTTPKGKDLLVTHLHIPEERISTVEHRQTLSLGNRTLEFLHMPWVHWPETMVSYLREDRILFSCDFFGSHLATSDLAATDWPFVLEAAKRYYAEIMMPFRSAIRKHLETLQAYPIDLIAPSHGPLFADPSSIMNGYRDWTSELPKNEVVIPFATMHGSTGQLVDRLVNRLLAKGIAAHPFDLTVTDLGKLAIALVDAATVVIGTPAVHVGPHPAVAAAVHLANCIRPKFRYASIIGSYGWANQIVERIIALMPNLKPEILEPVLCKGLPTEEDFAAIDRLADAIDQKHHEI